MGGQPGQEEREAEEQPQGEDGGDHDRACDLTLADLDVLLARVHVHRPDQRLHAEVQLLADQGEAAYEGQLPEGVDVNGRAQLAALDDDLLGRGQAHGHGIVLPAAHHHSLDDGLAAVEESLLGGGYDLRSWYLLRERHLCCWGGWGYGLRGDVG